MYVLSQVQSIWYNNIQNMDEYMHNILKRNYSSIIIKWSFSILIIKRI